jgi:hypothetical protein
MTASSPSRKRSKRAGHRAVDRDGRGRRATEIERGAPDREIDFVRVAGHLATHTRHRAMPGMGRLSIRGVSRSSSASPPAAAETCRNRRRES